MKSLQQPDHQREEFESSTPEEAVRLARQVLGDDAPVRCWRTRRGGMFGFFARELYVAAIEPPAPDRVSERPEKPAVRARSNQDLSEQLATLSAIDGPASPVTVEKLVEDTEDEVSLAALVDAPSAVIPEAAFIDMLAEAEAAVGGLATQRATDDPTCSPRAEIEGPERIPALRKSLADLGVPEDFLPREEDSTLDGLMRSLARLPIAKPVTKRGGSVIVVVGESRDVRIAATRVTKVLGHSDTDMFVAEQTVEGRRRVARRRSAKRTTVLVVEASLECKDLSTTASWIASLKPDRVIGVVPARTKRGDVERWCARLGRVDTLALSAVGSTATPGELMGTLPIDLIDGREASTLRWATVLLGMMPEPQR